MSRTQLLPVTTVKAIKVQKLSEQVSTNHGPVTPPITLLMCEQFTQQLHLLCVYRCCKKGRRNILNIIILKEDISIRHPICCTSIMSTMSIKENSPLSWCQEKKFCCRVTSARVSSCCTGSKPTFSFFSKCQKIYQEKSYDINTVRLQQQDLREFKAFLHLTVYPVPFHH